MDTLIFSQTAVFRLQQLGSQYYYHTNIRHKLSTQEGIIDLLKASSLMTERNVRTCYDAFVMELNKRQIDALAARGVRLREPFQMGLVASIRQAG